MTRVDVLNLEWTSYPSRDRNVASLVTNYLKYQGLSVYSDSVFRGFEMINKCRPKLLFITNGTGAPINFQLVKYAKLKGIKVLTLTSEGNFKDNLSEVDEFLWGWNNEKIMYEDLHLQWSERTKLLSIKKYPLLIDKIKVSGSVGLDIYKIFRKNRNEFLSKYKISTYDKIIGIGCWDFGIQDESDHRYLANLNKYGKQAIERFRNDMISFNKIILDIIETNQDILFIVKEHPGNTKGLDMSGADGVDKYPNVLILKHESIVDSINVSDFWITYESTTVIEAWALNKQTCLINPSGLDFPRANVYKGSPNYINSNAVNAAIKHFYSNNELPGFKELKKERELVINQISQWLDGLNHVRIGNEIINLLNCNRTVSNFSFNKLNQLLSFLNDRLKQKVFLHLPIKKGHSFIKDRLLEFNKEELKSFNDSLYNDQLFFYKKNNLDKCTLLEIRVK